MYDQKLVFTYTLEFDSPVEFTGEDAERLKARLCEAARAELADWVFLKGLTLAVDGETP